jgi:hypothetical protein
MSVVPVMIPLMTDPGPETDDRNPADVVTGMVDHVLELAATWPLWDVRLRSLSDQQLDEHAGDAWTLRQLAFHLADSAFYADSVGKLAR